MQVRLHVVERLDCQKQSRLRQVSRSQRPCTATVPHIGRLVVAGLPDDRAPPPPPRRRRPTHTAQRSNSDSTVSTVSLTISSGEELSCLMCLYSDSPPQPSSHPPLLLHHQIHLLQRWQDNHCRLMTRFDETSKCPHEVSPADYVFAPTAMKTLRPYSQISCPPPLRAWHLRNTPCTTVMESF